MLLVDTNIWLAAGDRRSELHVGCAQLVRERRDELACPVPVIAETSWLILDRLGSAAHSEFLLLVTSGRLQAVDLIGADWQRSADLVERYSDLRLDLMDASIVAVAERLKLTEVATMNRRDFTVVRPAHVDALTLLPCAWSTAPVGSGVGGAVSRC